MIGVFLLAFFGGMIVLGLPVVGCIVLSSSTIPLLNSAAPISFSSIAENSVAGAVQNNVGLTIVLFMIAGEFMARGKLTEKIFDTFAYFLGKKRAFMPILSICTCMFYGAISGYYGGKVYIVMTHFAEVLVGLPYVVVTILFMLLLGAGITSLILAMCVTGWIGTSRLIRAQFFRFKEREYVLAARTLGVGDIALIFRHILPNCVGPLITRAMIAIPGAIFSESFLAYIGLGIAPPEPSIGILLSDGQNVLLQYPYQTFFPAVLISVLMIAFNMFANGLRDALDPTKRGEE